MTTKAQLIKEQNQDIGLHQNLKETFLMILLKG
jgi:hypothetical protein